MASIGDAAEFGERPDALVSRVLGRVMRQARSVSTALGYVLALSRDTRANAWELAEKAATGGAGRACGSRREAGIPDGRAFATKPKLAVNQVKRVTAAGIQVLWAAADEVYGRCAEFRAALGCSAVTDRETATTRHARQRLGAGVIEENLLVRFLG